MSEWQPIETAPRDGSRFLGFQIIGPMNELGENDEILRRGIYEADQVVAYWLFGQFVSYPFNGGIPQNVRFTHWMPLPPPPMEKTNAD
jgi:hypothetical protein